MWKITDDERLNHFLFLSYGSRITSNSSHAAPDETSSGLIFMLHSMSLCGFISADHQVPVGSTVVDLKQCENCPTTFTRPRGSGIRYCRKCQHSLLMPDKSIESYRELLPSEAEQGHSHHLPHYDDSLTPREHSRVYTSQLTPIKRCEYRYNKLGNWKEKLRAAFVKQGALSAKEIQKTIGSFSQGPMLIAYIRSCGFELSTCGHVWPRTVSRGTGASIYRTVD